MTDTVAVAIHDVAPATFGRTALIRDWLDDHGIDRVTLLVVPAPDLHPFSTSSPELAEWLLDRVRRGDAIAQHGLTCRDTEFAGLGETEARRALDSGRRLLKLAGVEPHGFVAPGYAYTPALRATLRDRYAWWADLLRLHRNGGRADRARGAAVAARAARIRAARRPAAAHRPAPERPRAHAPHARARARPAPCAAPDGGDVRRSGRHPGLTLRIPVLARFPVTDPFLDPFQKFARVRRR